MDSSTELRNKLDAEAASADSFASFTTRVDPMNPEEINPEDADPETDEGKEVNGVTVKKENKGEDGLKKEDPASATAKLHASLEALRREAASQSDEDADTLQNCRVALKEKAERLQRWSKGTQKSEQDYPWRRGGG